MEVLSLINELTVDSLVAAWQLPTNLAVHSCTISADQRELITAVVKRLATARNWRLNGSAADPVDESHQRRDEAFSTVTFS